MSVRADILRRQIEDLIEVSVNVQKLVPDDAAVQFRELEPKEKVTV